MKGETCVMTDQSIEKKEALRKKQAFFFLGCLGHFCHASCIFLMVKVEELLCRYVGTSLADNKFLNSGWSVYYAILLYLFTHGRELQN